MLPDIALEALRYFDRTTLEGLQMHSRYLRDLVDRHARALPLRHIYSVVLRGFVEIRLTEDEGPGGAQAPDEQGLETLFHRVNNAYIHRLTLDFGRENLRFLHYLRVNANDLQCQIGALQVGATADAIDRCLVEFLGVYLKPQIYETTLRSSNFLEEYEVLFMHNALRGNIKHLVYEAISAQFQDDIPPILRNLFSPPSLRAPLQWLSAHFLAGAAHGRRPSRVAVLLFVVYIVLRVLYAF